MAKDTLTLTLTGEVPLSSFALAMSELNSLLEALTKDILRGEENTEIHWEVTELEAGSATAVITGFSSEIDKVERVVAGFGVVGTSLHNNRPIPYSQDVVEHARLITSLLNGNGNGYIKSVGFTTDEVQIILDTPIKEEKEITQYHRLGVIKGVVETIIGRPKVRITIYDALFDKAVTCHLESDQREMARNVWGKKVAVTGLIKRDQATGRPIEVREIVEIKEIHETPGSFKRAGGAIPWREGTRRSEEIIRESRDAN